MALQLQREFIVNSQLTSAELSASKAVQSTPPTRFSSLHQRRNNNSNNNNNNNTNIYNNNNNKMMNCLKSDVVNSVNQQQLNTSPEKAHSNPVGSTPITSYSHMNLFSNKMTLGKSRGMSLGKNGLGGGNFNAVNHGFPTKMPEIKPETSLQPSEEVTSLETKIQMLKSDPNLSAETKINSNIDISSSLGKKDEKFVEIENEIIKDVAEIKDSIEKLLEERKEIQQKHKVWLEDRKKKIFQVRKETNLMQSPGNAFPANSIFISPFAPMAPAAAK